MTKPLTKIEKLRIQQLADIMYAIASDTDLGKFAFTINGIALSVALSEENLKHQKQLAYDLATIMAYAILHPESKGLHQFAEQRRRLLQNAKQ